MDKTLKNLTIPLTFLSFDCYSPKRSTSIMLRTTLLFALFLLGLTACNNSGDVAADSVEETTDMAADTAGENTPAESDVETMIGDGFEVKVLDSTIKSPRKELSGAIDGVPVTINYGSPAVNDRTIYGDLVPYNKVWRTGANEATRITFGGDVLVGAEGKTLPAGTYSLFTLPASRESWTIVFNKVADQWGAYDYDDAEDAVRVSGVSMPNEERAERMDFVLDGEMVKLMWDDLIVGFTVAKPAK